MIAFDRTAWIAAALAAVLALAIASPFFGQGLDMVDEGRWLLGAQLILEGRDLHETTAEAGSGLREHVLATWMRVVGNEASSFTSLRSVGFALATASIVLLGATVAGIPGAIAAFIAALASLPLPPAVGVTWIATGLVVGFGDRRRRLRAIAVGAALGAVFLLDPRTLLIALFPLVHLFAIYPAWRREARALGAGLVAVLVMTVVLASVSAVPATTLGATFVEPAARGLGAVDPLRALRTAMGGAWLDQPFIGLRETGETWTAGWPAHGTLRALALRGLALGVPLLLVVSLVLRVRGRSRVAATMGLTLAATALLALLLRGDIPSLRAIAPLVAVTAGVLAGRGRGALVAVAVALCCVPLAAEPVWLAANHDRPNLVRNDGIAFDQARAARLQAMEDALHPRAREGFLIWPELPGLHWVLGTRPAARHFDVPRGDQADAETAAALRDRPPRAVLFGFSRGLLGHALQERAPSSWAVLRDGYRLRGRVLPGDENLRVLTRVGTGDPSVEGMAHQLPAVELTVSNDRSPALREDFTIGQGFRSGPRDIEGFAFRARTAGTNQRLRMRVSVWEWQADAYRYLIASEVVETTIRGDGEVVFLEFPIDDTANRDLAILMEAIGTPAREIRLDWRADDDPREPGDLYPQGDAVLGLTPVDADLYFLLY